MGKVILIGTGVMGIEYAKVLNALGVEYIAIGRGEQGATFFEEQTGHRPITGGWQKYFLETTIPADSKVILAHGSEGLMDCLKELLKRNVRYILCEKPGAISIEELIENEDIINASSSQVYVAFNRRFYSSVLEVEKMIAEDGGLLSVNFEFTEWPHVLEKIDMKPGVKENWFFTSCTHVIDLVFFFSGMPVNWSAFSSSGKITWHDKVRYAGAGITNQNIFFNYSATWESAGRWAIELLTASRRIYLKPIEGIQVQQKGSVKVDPYSFDDNFDKKFKPGLLLQTKGFLENNFNRMITIGQHIQNAKNIYSKMLLDSYHSKNNGNG